MIFKWKQMKNLGKRLTTKLLITLKVDVKFFVFNMLLIYFIFILHLQFIFW